MAATKVLQRLTICRASNIQLYSLSRLFTSLSMGKDPSQSSRSDCGKTLRFQVNSTFASNCNLFSSVWPAVLSKTNSRSIVLFSKNKGKRKTVRAVAQRFRVTGSGKVKHWRPGKNHLQLNKSKRFRRQARKPLYCNKTQAKMIKKMLNRSR